MLRYDEIQIELNLDRKELLPHIRGELFHITDEKGFTGISTSGVIRPSQGDSCGPFGMEMNCGKLKGNVCLFDCNVLSDEKIVFGLEGITLSRTLYYLFIDHSLRANLIQHKYPYCEGHLYCPNVEYGYHGEISIKLIRYVKQITPI